MVQDTWQASLWPELRAHRYESPESNVFARCPRQERIINTMTACNGFARLAGLRYRYIVVSALCHVIRDPYTRGRQDAADPVAFADRTYLA